MGVSTDLSSIPSVSLSVSWLVGLSGGCTKTADWIWMPFAVVSGVGRGMGGDRGRGN